MILYPYLWNQTLRDTRPFSRSSPLPSEAVELEKGRWFNCRCKTHVCGVLYSADVCVGSQSGSRLQQETRQRASSHTTKESTVFGEVASVMAVILTLS